MSRPTALPPGPRGLPVLGSVVPFSNDPLHFMSRVQRKYGNLVTVNVMGSPVICGFAPEHVQYCLTEHPRSFHSLQSGGGNLRDLLGDGLLTSEGDFHRQQRRLVQPAFHRQRIDSYSDTMVNYTLDLLQEWRPGQEVELSSQMQQLTLRIILKTMFNVASHEQAASLGKTFNRVIGGAPRRVIGQRLMSSMLGRTAKADQAAFAAGKQQLDDFVYSLISQHHSGEQDTGDILSMLLAARDNEQKMTDLQIRDQLMTFMAAGHETAQNSLCWTFYLLAQNPAVREKLLAELRTVLNGRPPTAADLVQMPYLEWVVNEAWRIYPPAWRVGRRAIEPIELGGYHFPVGTIVLLHQWVTQNLPEIWGDPENFRPERWDPEHNQKVPQGAYFPFSLGPRICIGMPFAQMEVRLLLATILQQYNLRLVPGQQIVPLPRVTIRPRNGIRMILEPAHA
ncbi:cytochrome P450 [Ktedonobacteria bacterium brp13]|nr:cytochrome P450 [Ktedonobacteria bacterium brp13]